MAALLGLDFDAARAVAEDASEGEVCQAANDNDPTQVVVSGHKTAVERAIELAKVRGARRAIMLPVSAPFHCSLMQPAADTMQEALADIQIAVPRVPVISNVSAQGETEPARIRELLVRQVTGSVRWRESVAWMAAQGTDEFWEIGPGKALSGMIRRIASNARTRTVATPADVAAAVGEAA
jgi:[acyl-carrier-protein] S-malonyltransferase